MSTADLYDLSIVVIVIIFAIRGFKKGFVHQIGALISMIAGLVVSVRYMPVLAEQLPVNENFKFICAFTILLFAVTLVVWGIVNLISKIISNLKLNSWNNQMGALFGVVYGVLCSIALTFVLLIYAVPVSAPVVNENGVPVEQQASNEPSFIMQSKSGPLLTTAALAIIDHLPQGGDYKFYDSLREYFQQNADEIKKNNPDLQMATNALQTSNESDSDEDKPKLPPTIP